MPEEGLRGDVRGEVCDLHPQRGQVGQVLGASEVSANLYCNSGTSVLGRLRDNLRLLMRRSVS